MKFLLIFIFFFSTFLSAQNDSISGNVKSVREKIILLDSIQNKELLEFGEEYGHFGFSKPELELSQMMSVWYHTASPGYVNYIRNFNESGQLISEEWFDMRDSIMYAFKYQYDKMGNLNQTLESNRGEEFSTVENYKYNHDGLLRTKIRVYIDSPEYYFYSIYQYDENNNLIQSQDFSEYGETGGMKYEYDDKGRKIKRLEWLSFKYEFENGSWTPKYNNEGSLGYSYSIYEYDESSNLIKEERYKQLDDRETYILELTYRYAYENENQISKSCIEMIDLKLPEQCVIYRYKDKLLKEKDGHDEKIFYKYVDSYISEIKYERKIFDKWKKSKVNFQYEFDLKGNWTKQTKIIDGVPLYVRIRDIKYFENR